MTTSSSFPIIKIIELATENKKIIEKTFTLDESKISIEITNNIFPKRSKNSVITINKYKFS